MAFVEVNFGMSCGIGRPRYARVEIWIGLLLRPGSPDEESHHSDDRHNWDHHGFAQEFSHVAE